MERFAAIMPGLRVLIAWPVSSTPMNVGAELAQLIRARDGIMHLLQEVPDLSEEEQAAAEGDRDILNKLIEKYEDVSVPPVPNERYIFNPATTITTRGKPLSVITAKRELRNRKEES